MVTSELSTFTEVIPTVHLAVSTLPEHPLKITEVIFGGQVNEGKTIFETM